jgi:DNA-directed RNA polymerase subunit RPC12/RpoP
MPVRFRCVYCNQLLGIARRKAGQVVRCTNCGGQIIVPDPEPRAAFVGAGGDQKRARDEVGPTKSNLFERGDLDELLKPFAVEKPALMDEPTARTPSSQEFVIPQEKLTRPIVTPTPRLDSRTWLLIAFGVVIAVVAFVAGYFAGKT